MRILIVSDYSPNETHGIAIHVRHLVANLQELGHEVRAFTCKGGETLLREGYRDPVLDEDALERVYRKIGS